MAKIGYYIHNAHLDKDTGPFAAERALEVKEVLLPHHKAGLSYTATGYGSKIPTPYLVLAEGRWRRVYSRCYSNVQSNFIIINGEETAVSLI